MQLTPAEETTLIAHYMPVVLIHVDDVGLPVDPAAWVAESALWSGMRPALDDSTAWGHPAGGDDRAPLVPRGALDIASLPQGLPSGQEVPGEYWLERGGWADSAVVSAGSDNRQPAGIRFGGAQTAATDAVTLRAECCGSEGFGTLSATALAALGLAPDQAAEVTEGLVILNYNMLFPGHLRGETALFSDGRDYDPTAYEGDWACFSVILTAPPGQGVAGLSPVYGAYSRRWRGQSQSHGEFGTIVGHDLVIWSEVPHTGDHPHVLVSVGNHNLYPADVQVEPGGGISLQSGSGWPAADNATNGTGGWVKKAVLKNIAVPAAIVGVTLAKMGAGFALLGPIGALGGLIAGIAEAGPIARAIGKDPGPIDIDPSTEKPPDGKLKDPKDKFKSPGVGTKMIIVTPSDAGVDPEAATAGLSFPAGVQAVVEWSARSYDRIDRAAEPFWPVYDGPHTRGYVGRWGARSASDPLHMRAGALLPDQRVEVLRHYIGVL